MNINFTTLKSLTIPEGNVTKIEDISGRVLWSAAKSVTLTIERIWQFNDVHHTWFIINGQTYDGGESVPNDNYSLPTYVSVNVGTKVMCCVEGTILANCKVNGEIVELTPSNDNSYRYYEYIVSTNATLKINEMHNSDTLYAGAFEITEQ